MPEPPRKSLDQVRDSLRMKQCSYRTEQTYVDWIKRYILFQIKQHPKDMGAPEIQAFLTYLAQDRRVSASTQYQALITLLCLYKNVLRQRIDHLPNLVHAG
jgi:Phage integrase, N-terminal SAM-like domain